MVASVKSSLVKWMSFNQHSLGAIRSRQIQQNNFALNYRGKQVNALRISQATIAEITGMNTLPLEIYIPPSVTDVNLLRSSVARNSLYIGVSYDSLSTNHYPPDLYWTFYQVDGYGEITRYDLTPGPQGEVRITSGLDACDVFVESVGLDVDITSGRGNWIFYRFANLNNKRCTVERLARIARAQRYGNALGWGYTFLMKLLEQGVLADGVERLQEYEQYIRTMAWRHVTPYRIRHPGSLPRDFTMFGA
ncbi:hypothetical protein VNI00_008449 [Paramarasmius palmivorus]|uniref:Uncharacterized protein n=1 Tax=Paramarasmius palmivorus TaxID=297713 RepID=A0AAW0CXT1_9AGAR